MDSNNKAIIITLAQPANITDNVIVLDRVPESLVVGDAIYITNNSELGIAITPTDSKVITAIEGNTITLHNYFLADNYPDTGYAENNTILPAGAKVKNARRT